VTELREQSSTHAPPVAPARVRRLRWWREVLYILAFYFVYSLIRNTQGSASVGATHAFNNARDIIHLEKLLGMYHERWIQQQFLDWHGFIEFWNLFYGTFHFFVTIGALLVLFFKFPARYPKWRNTLACTTALALIGFATYPLMPPRLLPASYDYIDTLRAYGSLWSFDSGAMNKISNQYAAMPSLHFAWSTWCAFVLFPVLRWNWWKAVIALYPVMTLFAIIVTANHYWIDAAGGAVILAAGYWGGSMLTRTLERRALGPAAQRV
jgi:hypothetical protein